MTSIDVQQILDNGHEAASNALNAFTEQLSSLGAKMSSEVDSEAHQVSLTTLDFQVSIVERGERK